MSKVTIKKIPELFRITSGIGGQTNGPTEQVYFLSNILRDFVFSRRAAKMVRDKIKKLAPAVEIEKRNKALAKLGSAGNI